MNGRRSGNIRRILLDVRSFVPCFLVAAFCRCHCLFGGSAVPLGRWQFETASHSSSNNGTCGNNNVRVGWLGGWSSFICGSILHSTRTRALVRCWLQLTTVVLLCSLTSLGFKRAPDRLQRHTSEQKRHRLLRPAAAARQLQQHDNCNSTTTATMNNIVFTSLHGATNIASCLS